MYSLLIVDDEPAIREGMVTLIEWESLGFRVAGVAADGQEGLRLYRELAPDLILVDIRMPKMTGLELVEEIRRQDSLCRILVLSGHADFAYAQQAIRCGIEGYLLKPVDEAELEEYARRIARSLDAERSSRRREDLPHREAALQALLDGDGAEALRIAAAAAERSAAGNGGAAAGPRAMGAGGADADVERRSGSADGGAARPGAESSRAAGAGGADVERRSGSAVGGVARPGAESSRTADAEQRSGSVVGGPARPGAESSRTAGARGAEADAEQRSLSADGGADAQLWRLLHGGAPGGRVLLVEKTLQEDGHPAELKLWLEEAAAERGLGLVFAAGNAVGLLLPAADEALRAAQVLIAEDSRGEIIAAAGCIAAAPGVVPQSLHQAQELLKLRFLMEPGRLYTEPPELLAQGAGYGGLAAATATGLAVQPAGRSVDLAAHARNLSLAIETGGSSEIVSSLDEIAAVLAAADASRPAFASAMAQLLTLSLAELARYDSGLESGRQSSLAASVYRHDSWSTMREELAVSLIAVQQSLDISDSGSVLRRMTAYMDRHYSESLRLETLAEVFGYNSGYLGKLFKSHTGESFNVYLDRLRIKRAISMLEGGMKVRQTAEKIGYANVDYFHAKFKKYTGKSPSSYKKTNES